MRRYFWTTREPLFGRRAHSVFMDLSCFSSRYSWPFHSLRLFISTGIKSVVAAGTDWLPGAVIGYTVGAADAVIMTESNEGGRVTMTTDSSKNGAKTLSLINFSGHAGQVTISS